VAFFPEEELSSVFFGQIRNQSAIRPLTRQHFLPFTLSKENTNQSLQAPHRVLPNLTPA